MPRPKPPRAAPTPNAPPDALAVTTPAPALVARFANDLHRLTDGDPPARIGVAVSGGPDSMAMLMLAAAAWPGQVWAATVDHHLRANAAAEAAFVAASCMALGVPHAMLSAPTARRGNVSANARAARYAVLDAWAGEIGCWLLTAHHADDQLETMVMRLNRSAGVGGLAGVRARHGHRLRPLLGWRRAELAAIVAACGIGAVDDPTNRDDRYDRARLRKVLAGVDWLDPVAAARSAAALAEADAALDWIVAQFRTERLFPEPGGRWRYEAHDLPPEIARRVLVDCLRVVEPTSAPRGSDIDRLLATVHRDAIATLGAVQVRGMAGGTRWHFAPCARRARPH